MSGLLLLEESWINFLPNDLSLGKGFLPRKTGQETQEGGNISRIVIGVESLLAATFSRWGESVVSLTLTVCNHQNIPLLQLHGLFFINANDKEKIKSRPR